MVHIASYPWSGWAQTRPSPPDFVLPGFALGTLGLLTAPTKSGKTWAALHLGVSVATGRSPGTPWDVHRSGPVYYLNAEDAPTLIHHRVYQLAQSLPWPPETPIPLTLGFALQRDLRLVQLTDTGGLVVNATAQNILAQLAQNHRLLILDPFNKFHAVDENNNNHMNRLIDELARLAGNSCSILLIHHTGKKGDARGASALPAGVQWHAELKPLSNRGATLNGSGGRLTIVKNQWGVTDSLTLRWGVWPTPHEQTPPASVSSSWITPEEFFADKSRG